MLNPVFENSDNYAADRANVEAAFSKLNTLAASHASVASLMQYFTNVPIRIDSEEFKDNGRGTAQLQLISGGNSYIAVNPGNTYGVLTDTAGNSEPYAKRSLARTIFHELFHAATLAGPEDISSFALPQNPGINLNEAAAIFAENLIFAPVAGESFRMGHVNWIVPAEERPSEPMNSSAFANATGMNAFSWITSTSGPSFSNTNSGPRFSKYSNDGMLGVTKTYLKSDIGLGHYLELIGQNNLGFLSISKNKIDYGAGIRPLIESMMGGGLSGFKEAVSVVSSLYKDHGYLALYDLNLYRVIGVGGDNYYDRAKGSDQTYFFTGVNFRIHDKNHTDIGGFTAPTVSVSAEGSDHNILVFGAGGTGPILASSDILTGGYGSDFLLSTAAGGKSILNGGDGNDVIVGAGIVGDVILGGSGNDILIGRTRGAFYNGGNDDDILSYHHLGSSNPISVNADFRAVSSRSGTDNYANIEIIIGTPGGDIFNLNGSHPVIYGGAGGDRFYGDPIASLYGGSGTDTLDLSATSVPFQTPFFVFDSIEIIYGSKGNDVFLASLFKNTEANVRNSISAGEGDDIIESKGTMNVLGENGKDTVYVLTEGYGVLDGGSGFDTLDFTRISGTSLSVRLDGTSNGTYRVNSGDDHRFTSFEEVKFGSLSLSLYGKGTFTGGTGNNFVSGGEGVDDITVGGTGGYVYAGGGNDILRTKGLESVWGEDGNDRLYAGNDIGARLYGGMRPGTGANWFNDGDDYLQGGLMSDLLNGGTGKNELHGGGGYDHFYSGGYGENSVYGEADLGAMHYSFVGRGGYPLDPDLVSIKDMGGWFDVVTASDRGRTYRTDHLHEIDKVYFEDMTFSLTPGFSYQNPDYMI